MTTPSNDPSQQWQQPSWRDAHAGGGPSDPPAVEPSEPALPLAGSVLVPNVRRPPSAVESTLNVVAAVAWPVAVVLAIMGMGGWFLNLGAAFVVSALVGAISGELRKRRSGE